MKTFIHKIELVEDEEGEVPAAPYYRAHIDGVNGGTLEVHLAGQLMEVTVISADDSTVTVKPEWIAHAYKRLYELSFGEQPPE